MVDNFTIIVIFLGILAVLGLIGILIEPLLRDKKQSET
jgi:NADH:ubiquinone oxidoreductase subunit 3 (subunit A)